MVMTFSVASPCLPGFHPQVKFLLMNYSQAELNGITYNHEAKRSEIAAGEKEIQKEIEKETNFQKASNELMQFITTHFQ